MYLQLRTAMRALAHILLTALYKVNSQSCPLNFFVDSPIFLLLSLEGKQTNFLQQLCVSHLLEGGRYVSILRTGTGNRMGAPIYHLRPL